MEIVDPLASKETRLNQLRDFVQNMRWIICIDDKGVAHTIDLKKEKP